MQVGHEEHVLLAGDQAVDGGELPGDADRGAYRLRVAARSWPRDLGLPAVGGDEGGEDLARRWSCRRRSGRAGRRRCPAGMGRSMPSSTVLSPYDLRRPTVETAAGGCGPSRRLDVGMTEEGMVPSRSKAEVAGVKWLWPVGECGGGLRPGRGGRRCCRSGSGRGPRRCPRSSRGSRTRRACCAPARGPS